MVIAEKPEAHQPAIFRSTFLAVQFGTQLMWAKSKETFFALFVVYWKR
jgi:hypothetical protein